MTAHAAAAPYAARLKIDYPERLDRLSTVFRLIWIVPIAIVLGLLTASGNQTMVTASGQQVAGTGGGLLAGLAGATALMIIVRLRYPRWWFDFARELTRFGARVSAYLALLTDRYPSTVDEQSVHLEIEYPDVERDLNRWLPLVKWLLAIPHYFVLAIPVDRRPHRHRHRLVRDPGHGPLSETAVRLRGRRQPVDIAGHRLRLPARYRSVSAIQPQRRGLAMTNFPTNSWRKLALAGGVLYLMTFAFSIPAVFLLEPVLSNPDYIVSGGADSQVLLGTLFDLITALACIGTAVALFPVIRRQSETASLGFVTTRIFEGAIIVIGVASLMAVVAMRQAGGATGTDSSGLVAVGQALVAVRDQTFLLGPGVMPGLNALLLGYVLYRSRLVPRLIPAVGLIGAPIFLASATATLLGVNEQVSLLSGIAVVPIFFWELSLGLWLTFKGFSLNSPLIAAAEAGSSEGASAVAPSGTAVATKAGVA